MSFLHLFFTFLKIGLFTIGGGYAMIPLIQSEVLANGWLTQQQLVDFIAVSESTPGPFADQYCYFCRYENLRRIGCVSNYDRCNSSIVCDHFAYCEIFSVFSPKSVCPSCAFRSASCSYRSDYCG